MLTKPYARINREGKLFGPVKYFHNKPLGDYAELKHDRCCASGSAGNMLFTVIASSSGLMYFSFNNFPSSFISDIDWGDGYFSSDNQGGFNHEYQTEGTYQVKITIKEGDISLINQIDLSNVQSITPNDMFAAMTGVTNLTIRDSGITSLPIIPDGVMYAYFNDNKLTSIQGLPDTVISLSASGVTNRITSMTVPPLVNYLYMPDSVVDAATVNSILIQLDTHGLSSGNATLIGNPAPTGAGLTAKTNLQGKSWSVVTA